MDWALAFALTYNYMYVISGEIMKFFLSLSSPLHLQISNLLHYKFTGTYVLLLLYFISSISIIFRFV